VLKLKIRENIDRIRIGQKGTVTEDIYLVLDDVHLFFSFVSPTEEQMTERRQIFELGTG